MRPLNPVLAANSSLMCTALLSPDTPANRTMSASVMVLAKVADIPIARSSISEPCSAFIWEIPFKSAPPPRQAQGLVRFGGDFSRHLLGTFEQYRPRNDIQNNTQVLRFVRFQRTTREGQFSRALIAHEPLQKPSAAIAGNNPNVHERFAH